MKKVEKKQENSSFLQKFYAFWASLSDNTAKLSRKDFIILGILVVFYLIISFYHLGTLNSPKTYYNFKTEGEVVSVYLSNGSQDISKIRYYTGAETGTFSVIASNDGDTYQEIATLEEKSVFAWEDLEVDTNFKYLKFVSKTDGSYIGEIQLYNKYGEKDKNSKATRLCLHANRLKIYYPKIKKEIMFEVKTPKEFKKLI